MAFGIDALKKAILQAIGGINTHLTSLGLQEDQLASAVAKLERTQEQMSLTIADLDTSLDQLGNEIVTESQAVLGDVNDLASKVQSGQPVDLTNEVQRINNAISNLQQLGAQVRDIDTSAVVPTPPGPPPTG